MISLGVVFGCCHTLMILNRHCTYCHINYQDSQILACDSRWYDMSHIVSVSSNTSTNKWQQNSMCLLYYKVVFFINHSSQQVRCAKCANSDTFVHSSDVAWNSAPWKSFPERDDFTGYSTLYWKNLTPTHSGVIYVNMSPTILSYLSKAWTPAKCT